jgi:hypothetical protein
MQLVDLIAAYFLTFSTILQVCACFHPLPQRCPISFLPAIGKKSKLPLAEVATVVFLQGVAALSFDQPKLAPKFDVVLVDLVALRGAQMV